MDDLLRMMIQAACQQIGIDPERVEEMVADIEKQREKQMWTPLTDEQARGYLNTLFPYLWVSPTGFTN